MFERLTGSARAVIAHAQRVGGELGQRTIGVPDLLLALMEVPDQMAGDILREAGLDGEWLRDGISRTADAALLETLGIDLTAVRSHVEQVFGDGALDRATNSSGHRPLTKTATKMLELALRESLARQDRTTGTEHILLAIFRERGDTADLLRSTGVDRALVESQIDRRRAAA